MNCMNWACINFDAKSIFLNIKQWIFKAVHKPILSHIVPFTHKTNSFCILLWGGLGLPWGGLGVAWGWPGVVWGWPGGGLVRFYYPGTIRESMKNYPGFWVGWLGLAGAGWGWLGLAGAGWGCLVLAGCT